MARQVLIIHGWSDTSRSFGPLARFLAANGYEPKVLWLGDYISKDDDVRVDDVAARMAEVIDEKIAAGELQKSFDVIVHSTGGLVARAWLVNRYRGEAERCPMKRLVMLAPANYGSKLAATGKSMLGRVIKGYDNWFQSGQSMLNDLELASRFQWELAQRDVLIAPGGSAAKCYGDDRVWPFVITGTHPYVDLLRQIVNENGSDGTVRVCAANLNARGVTIDFTKAAEKEMFKAWESRLDCDVPLAVLPTRTHASIIDPGREARANREGIAETPEEKAELGRRLLEALGCRNFDAYRAIAEAWSRASEATAGRSKSPPKGDRAEFFHQYMQVNASVVDDQGARVDDYFLEFFSNPEKLHDPNDIILHTRVLKAVKPNSLDPSLRNLYFDRTDLMEHYYPNLPPGTPPMVYMSISAASPGPNVSYFESDKQGAERWFRVHLEGDRTKRWLSRNTTHFLKIIVPRRPGQKVFRLTNVETGR